MPAMELRKRLQTEMYNANRENSITNSKSINRKLFSYNQYYNINININVFFNRTKCIYLTWCLVVLSRIYLPRLKDGYIIIRSFVTLKHNLR